MTTLLDSIRSRVDARSPTLLQDGSGERWQASDIISIVGSLSQHLSARGVSRSDRVAIIVPDGPSLCLAFLCVSCHAVAAPLNPKASTEDLRSWLQDLEPAAILVTEASPSAAADVAAALGIPVIRFDSVVNRRKGDAPQLPQAPEPDDIALILHTSGTTARAKMVPLTHRNLLRSAHAIAGTLRLGPDDVCLNLMPMFHILGIVACLLAPLVSGGRVIVSEGMDSARFFRLLIEMRPTWYSSVPTRHIDLLDHLKRHPESINGHALRFIRSSSAALPVSVLFELESRFGVPVVEAYAMTEASQMCSNPLPTGIRKPGSVGKAAGPEVAVVDGDGRILPAGTSGEVVIRGVNVTSGYLGLPEEEQGRLAGGWFRTGDLGQFDEEGYLFLSGRVKEIVSRGGEKVSPAEVDAVLLQHPAVLEAACFGVPHPRLGEDLAAAVRLHPGQAAGEALLRDYLFERLSHYKIPSRILVVDSIPKSSIGKVQRSRLAQALQGLLSPVAAMPSNPAEAYVADVFRQVIPGCGPVGLHDNFFSLGGDSLHGIRAAHLIGAHYRIEMPAHEIFRHPTPESLSRRIEELRSAQLLDGLSHADSDAILPDSRTQPIHDGADIVYPASLIQVLFWRHDRWNPNAPRNPQGSMYHLQGRVDVEALRSAIQLLSTSQPALRTVFFERNGEVYQRVKPHLPIPLELVKTSEPLLETSPDMLPFLTLPFDLERGPLLRFRLVSQGEDSHILQVAKHHVVFDAVSMGQMFRELSEYYNDLISGEQPKPKARRVSLGELAMEECGWMVSEEASKSLDYWMERLDLRGMEHGWPGDGPGEVSSGIGRSVYFETALDRTLSGRIHACLGQRGTTFFRFLLGTYFLTLQGLLPGRAVTVGVPVSLRRTQEENELIGCLISTLPVTLESILSGTASDRFRLAERRLDEGMRHGRINWQHIVDRWKPRRGVSSMIEPKTVMNFRERARGSLDLKELRVEHIPARTLFQSMDLQFMFDWNQDRSSGEDIRIAGSYDDARMTRAQVDLVMDAWVSVMRHCTDGEAFALAGAAEARQRVFAFAGGAGGFDEHAKFHRMGEALGEGVRLQVLPDPEASFGLLPGVPVPELARGYAEQIMQTSSKGKVWLVGEGLGAVDAFATARMLQRNRVEDIGLILLAPELPNPSERVHTVRPTAVEAYGRMPEKWNPVQEWLFDLRLQAATRGPLRRWSHPVPKSRRQVFRAALAYGLFDSEYYTTRYGEDGQAGTEESWFRYLSDGWRAGRHPSERFHAYRYEGMVEGFAVGSDEPVLHALLFGMRKVETRRRMLEGLERPLDSQEILSARERLRMEAIGPERLCGKAHLVMTGKGPGMNAQDQWQAWVDGQVQSHHADAGLVDRLESIARIIQGVI